MSNPHPLPKRLTHLRAYLERNGHIRKENQGTGPPAPPAPSSKIHSIIPLNTNSLDVFNEPSATQNVAASSSAPNPTKKRSKASRRQRLRQISDEKLVRNNREMQAEIVDILNLVKESRKRSEGVVECPASSRPLPPPGLRNDSPQQASAGAQSRMESSPAWAAWEPQRLMTEQVFGDGAQNEYPTPASLPSRSPAEQGTPVITSPLSLPSSAPALYAPTKQTVSGTRAFLRYGHDSGHPNALSRAFEKDNERSKAGLEGTLRGRSKMTAQTVKQGSVHDPHVQTLPKGKNRGAIGVGTSIRRQESLSGPNTLHGHTTQDMSSDVPTIASAESHSAGRKRKLSGVMSHPGPAKKKAKNIKSAEGIALDKDIALKEHLKAIKNTCQTITCLFDGCNKECKNFVERAFTIHLETAHFNSLNQLECMWPQCDYEGTFEERHPLARHVLEKHCGDAWLYQCPDCSSAPFRPDLYTVRRHNKKHAVKTDEIGQADM